MFQKEDTQNVWIDKHNTVIIRLNKFLNKGIIKINRDIHNPLRTYEFIKLYKFGDHWRVFGE